MTSRVLPKAERLLAAGAAVGPVLGVDTAGRVALVALTAHGRVLAETARPATSHCAGLPAATGELLEEAGLALRDLKGISVGLGPGSFTGLRVGLSYAKGLGLALGCALVGVPTFDSMALAALEAAHGPSAGVLICPVVDAHKGEVYAALYRTTLDGVEKLTDALVLPVEALVRQLSGEIIFAGGLKAGEASRLAGERGLRSAVLEEGRLDSRGRYVAALGAARLAQREAGSPAALEPLYVRTAQATFKPAAAAPAAGKEVPWSAETKRLSSSI